MVNEITENRETGLQFLSRAKREHKLLSKENTSSYSHLPVPAFAAGRNMKCKAWQTVLQALWGAGSQAEKAQAVIDWTFLFTP